MAKKKHKRWTKKEEASLVRSYNFRIPLMVLARRFGRSREAVNMHASIMGLTKKKHKLSKEVILSLHSTGLRTMEIANKLGVSYSCIASRFYAWHIKPNPSLKWNPEVCRDLVSCYISGMPLHEIAKKFNSKVTTIRYKVYELGVSKRTGMKQTIQNTAALLEAL